MATTPRAGLRYPGLVDAPNVPGDFANLALDTDGKLFRAFPCTDGTKPAGLVSGDRGFLIDNGDTGNIERWTGSAWAVIGGGGGGGGSAYIPVKGQWKASTNQSISDGTDTPVAFGTEEIASAIVSRSTLGAGHKFTLAELGTYAISTTVRFAPGAAGGNRFIELRNAADTGRWASQGNDGGPAAVTLSVAVTDRFAAGTELYVCAFQNSGASLALQRASTTPAMEGFVTIRIVKIAG